MDSSISDMKQRTQCRVDFESERPKVLTTIHLVPYPDHLYLYTGNSYHYAATRPQQWPPDTVGRYRNTDPVLISYLIRLAVEKSEEYLSFP
jgi:hypothetical protein